MTAAGIQTVGFSERLHFDCTEQALEVVLRRAGFELEDVICREWEFQFRRNLAGPHFLVASGNELDWKQKFRSYGIGLVTHRSSTPAAALRNLAVRTARGEAIPVWLDPYYLPYYAANNPRHARHAVVVADYDAARHTLGVVDPSPWQQFRGEIATGEVLAGMASAALPEQERNFSILLGFPERRPAITPEEFGLIVRMNLRAMLSREGATPVVEEEISIVHGIAGMRRFADMIRGWQGRPPSQVARDAEQVRSQLSVLCRRRYGHARFLISAARAFPSREQMEWLGVRSTDAAVLRVKKGSESVTTVSLCLITHNARQSAAALVERLRPVVDEVVCWDQDSQDGTARMLESCADLLLSVPYKGFDNLDRISFPRVATTDWILSCEASAVPTDELMAFLHGWRERPMERVEVFWVRRRIIVDEKDVSQFQQNPYRPLLWRRLNARGQASLVYDEPFGNQPPRAQTPFQAWLGDDLCLEYRHRFDALMRRHLEDVTAEKRRLLQLPDRRREGRYLARLAQELGRPMPQTLQELEAAS